MRTRWWLLLSGLAHGALTLVDPPAVVPRALPVHPVEVELTTPDPVAIEPEASEAPALSVKVAPARTRKVPVAEPAPPVVEEPAREPVEVAPPAPVVSLSPRAAALSMLALGDDEGEIDAGAPQRGPVRSSEQLALEASLMEAVRKVDTRHEPTLHPKPGGGYTFTGNGFDATINPDGSVDMADNFTHSKFTWPIPFVGRTVTDASGFWYFQSKFRLYEWLDRKLFKNDPFQSERRWFMDSTRPLREDMAAHFHDRRVHSRAP